MSTTRDLQKYFNQQDAEPISACEAFQLLLSTPAMSAEKGTPGTVKLYAARETVQLKKAKWACERNMVIHPNATNHNIFYCPKEAYSTLLQKKQAMNPKAVRESKFAGANM